MGGSSLIEFEKSMIRTSLVEMFGSDLSQHSGSNWSIPGFDAEVVEGDLGNVMTWKMKKDRITDDDKDGDVEDGGTLADGRYRALSPRSRVLPRPRPGSASESDSDLDLDLDLDLELDWIGLDWRPERPGGRRKQP